MGSLKESARARGQLRIDQQTAARMVKAAGGLSAEKPAPKKKAPPKKAKKKEEGGVIGLAGKLRKRLENLGE